MTTEEVLFEAHDEGWNRPLPVTLITYKDGSQDLHRQTGFNFEEAVERARALLAARGLEVAAEPSFLAPSGAYLSVTAKVEEPQTA